MTQAEPQHDSLVGQVVGGKYRIARLLGEGGMGCVYLAEQQLGTSTRKVALKTLHKHLSHDPSIKARFDREAGTVAALEHPNTIQVYDFGEMADGTLYLVMEFVQGKSVADILEKEGPMQPPRVENILRQVCGSLAEAHGHGIVHRDLKPDNVVLCERAGQKDWVEVLDFGIAKRSSEHDPNEAKLTQQGMVLGTPPYMSPEQFTGQPVDVRSDIYALGVMAYEMLTGRLPWVANTAWEWASKHMTEQPTPLERQPLGDNVPAHQRAAIARALAKNKDERFGNVTEFYEAFSGGGGVPGLTGQMEAQPTSSPAASGGRAKTEMAQPAFAGGGGGFAAPVTPAQPSPAVVPTGPSHGGPAKKSGPPGIVIGLGLLAVVLIGGGVAAALKGKSKPPVVDTVVTTTPTETTTTAQPSASTPTETPPEVASVAPLGGGAAPLPATNVGTNTGGTKTVKPVPTPKPQNSTKPPPAEPPVCAQARSAKAKSMPPTIVASLERQCTAAGGKL